MKLPHFLSIIFLVATLQSCFRADENPVQIPPVTGTTLQPLVGGAAQPNQVWIRLSDATSTVNRRTDWDLAFYNGEQFRVLINSSVIIAAGKIEGATDIDAVKESDVAQLQQQVQIGTFDEANLQYVDSPDGNFLNQKTGIAELTEDQPISGVYLVNMGRDIYTGQIAPGSAITGGESRGWKKIQLERLSNGYLLKYADLNEKTHHTHQITKNAEYNFTFFSMQTKTERAIQPKKKSWDLGFTVFTNEVFTTAGEAAGTYIFADFILTNTLDGVTAYPVVVAAGQSAEEAYSNFKLSDVDASKFIGNDQRAIGDKWRTTTGANGAQVYANKFFILKSADGFYFKLRFTRMTNTEGERGHPQFEYDPL